MHFLLISGSPVKGIAITPFRERGLENGIRPSPVTLCARRDEMSRRGFPTLLPALVSDHPQLFVSRRQDLAPGLRYHHRVFDADAAETLQIYAGFDGDCHAGLQAGLVALAEARGFVDLQAEAVAGSTRS